MDGLLVSVSVPHALGRWFAPRSGHTIDHHEVVHIASLSGKQALGEESCNAAPREFES